MISDWISGVTPVFFLMSLVCTFLTNFDCFISLFGSNEFNTIFEMKLKKKIILHFQTVFAASISVFKENLNCRQQRTFLYNNKKYCLLNYVIVILTINFIIAET